MSRLERAGNIEVNFGIALLISIPFNLFNVLVDGPGGTTLNSVLSLELKAPTRAD